ncbi:MAG: O-antigen ligase family protein [Desulfobacula sp.]|nr:O-antigen ligase family protein [Desulfobacula sp.]
MQYFSLDYLKLVSIAHYMYTTDAFFESVDMVRTRRSPGISSQIGGHGAIMMSMGVIMLSAIMNKCNLKLMSFIGFVLSLIILILNQSRTSFVATAIAISLLMIYYLLFGSYTKKLKMIFIYSMLASICAVIVIKYDDISFKVGYLYKLSKLSNSLGAATSRLDKWENYFGIAEERIWWLFTGWGKDYFGISSASFDNDYLHIFFVYGPMVLMLFIMFLVYYIFKTLISSKKYVSRNFEMTFFFVLMGGLVIAGGASFIMYPQIIFLSFFLYIGKYWEKTSVLSG